MPLPEKRKVAALCGDGHIRLIEDGVPELKPGSVLVEVHASLVSPGTELGGWRALREKREKPDPEAKARPFGYSNAGIVLETAGEASDHKQGGRVACIGVGYAMHTDYAVVPHNLCVSLPDNVSFVQGSYAMLAATALHALRRGAPGFGEFAAVVGLGIVGQLAAQLYKLAGNYVIGLDTIPFRVGIAEKWGIDEAVVVGRDDEVETTLDFTRGRGLDTGVLAFGGDGNKAMASLEKCMKCSPDGHPMGRVVIVGAPSLEYRSSLTNIDYRRSSRTGYGYHDEDWEYGRDYPPVFLRWTTRSNLELCMRLISEGRLDVDCLTTHEVLLSECDKGISDILRDPDRALGVAFIRS